MLSYEALIDALAEAFRSDIDGAAEDRPHDPAAVGQRGEVPADAGLDRTNSGERFIGCKLVSVFPDNAKAGKPSVYGNYLLMSGDTGETLALMDGTALTAWRTAAASALAARYLAREDASHLVMVGAGALAPHLVRAHRAVRPITRVTLWNRTRSRAISTAFALTAAGIETAIADDLEAAVREADIVSCATLSADAARSRRLAEEGRPCRSGRRLHAEDARGRRRRGAPRPRVRRQPRQRGQGLRRHRHPAEEEDSSR